MKPVKTKTNAYYLVMHIIHYLHKSHTTVHLGGLFALKQWISCSLEHDTVARVNNLYRFYVKNPPKQIALWDCASCEFREMDEMDEKVLKNQTR